MSRADNGFGLLIGWIKDFKVKQGRDPFFEDFPANIGTTQSRTVLQTLQHCVMLVTAFRAGVEALESSQAEACSR